MKLSDEAKVIEYKLTRVMKDAKISNPSQLMSLEKTKKLKYFFKAFLSSSKQKKRHTK